MKVIESWEIESNFWKINNQFLVPEVFKSLYDKDKSKDKLESSRLMWGLALYCDSTSKYRQLEDTQRKELIARDYLKDPKFKWKDFKEQINAWNLFKTSIERQIEQWERLMNEKSVLMSNLKYDIDNWEELEKMMISNTKLYNEYEQLLSRLGKSEDTGVAMGGAKESLSELGVI